ncbi:MAG: hypothetical protein R3F33_10895 [Planctomycetota bacterium]
MKRSQRLIALLLLPALFACRSNPNEKGEMTDSEKVGLYFERALRYYEMRELDRCQDQVQRGLEIDPDNERLLLMLGRCYQTRGTLPDVLAAEKIFRDHPAKNDYRVHLGLGGAMERKGSFYDQAARNIESGETYTEAADPTARVAELRTNAQTAWVQAIESYKLALERFPGSFEALNGLMRTTALAKDYAASFEWSAQLLQSISESNNVYIKRQREMESRSEPTAEIEKTLLANESLEIDVRIHRAELLHRSKDLVAALTELDRAMALDDARPDIYARRGQLLRELGEYQRSTDSLERYLSLSTDPFDHPNVRQAFEWIEANKHDMGR